MRSALHAYFGVIGAILPLALSSSLPPSDWRTEHRPVTSSLSARLFTDLERLSRLVDIAYCVGNTGVRRPFRCLSHCNDFPELSLVTTWSTGTLLGDSCGYIALEHPRWQGPRGSASPGGDPSASEHGAIIVAFRGTYTIANTIADLSTVPQHYVPYRGPGDEDSRFECVNCTVHTGFYRSWLMARDTILPELTALRTKFPSYTVQLVGHSLGGAVACLAALELRASLGWEDVVVSTFGESRVGNRQLARFVDEVFELNSDTGLEAPSYRRVTHEKDPVPLLPLAEWGFSSHAGEIFISKPELPPSRTDVRSCIGDEDPACSAGNDSPLWRKTRGFFAAKLAALEAPMSGGFWMVPNRFRLWQFFFAHRDYFLRLGLCVPGGDPANRFLRRPAGLEVNEL